MGGIPVLAAVGSIIGGSIERSAEDLVVRWWTRKIMDAAVSQLNQARAKDPDSRPGRGERHWDRLARSGQQHRLGIR
jgi:hypothetical protein